MMPMKKPMPKKATPVRKPLPTPAGRGTPVRKPGPGVMKPAVMPGRKKAY